MFQHSRSTKQAETLSEMGISLLQNKQRDHFLPCLQGMLIVFQGRESFFSSCLCGLTDNYGSYQKLNGQCFRRWA